MVPCGSGEKMRLRGSNMQFCGTDLIFQKFIVDHLSVEMSYEIIQAMIDEHMRLNHAAFLREWSTLT